MDENEILSATLNNTIGRMSRMAQNYEVEIANLTAEVVRQKARADALESAAESSAPAAGAKHDKIKE